MTENQYNSPTPFEKTDPLLIRLGWRSTFQAHLNQLDRRDEIPARVVGVRKNRFSVSRGNRVWMASAAGRLNQRIDTLFPVIGDWVMVNDAVIRSVLPRFNALVRGSAGSRGKQASHAVREQVIASNIDTVFIVCGLDRDFNLRRIERYLTLVYNCGLAPVIILTKADLVTSPEAFASQVESIAFGIPVHVVSATTSAGLAPLAGYLGPGRTITMIGSSGTGKSTLLNRLYGAPVQATGSVSERFGKGMHTTTSRDLIIMPQGGMVIDNPGIREIALWDGEDGPSQAFPEIERLAAACRFSDCSHRHEPGCRVRQAIADGEILADRLESYHKLERERSYVAQRQHKSADRLEKERWKEVSMKVRSINKRKGRGWNP